MKKILTVIICAALVFSSAAVLICASAAAAGTTEAATEAVAAAVESPAAAEEDEGFVNRIVRKITTPMYSALEGKISDRVLDLAIPAVISLLPILECRGGMIAAKLLNSANESGQNNLLWAFIICYIFNMIPVPFILLFIKKIFSFMKKHGILTGFIEKLEGKGEKNREKILRYKQWGLLLFVAVPLPGTGAWTGSLFASLLNIDFKKALPIVAIGVLIANLIMAVVTYGTGALFGF